MKEFKYLEGEIDRRTAVVSAVTDHYFQEGAEPEDKPFDFPVDLHSNPPLWPCALGSDQKNKVICRELGAELLRQKELAGVVLASWMPFLWRVSGHIQLQEEE